MPFSAHANDKTHKRFYGNIDLSQVVFFTVDGWYFVSEQFPSVATGGWNVDCLCSYTMPQPTGIHDPSKKYQGYVP